LRLTYHREAVEKYHKGIALGKHLRKDLAFSIRMISVETSKSSNGLRHVSPAVLFADIVPVSPVSVKTVGFCWSLDTATGFLFQPWGHEGEGHGNREVTKNV
jgi:hypothetical protein